MGHSVRGTLSQQTYPTPELPVTSSMLLLPLLLLPLVLGGPQHSSLPTVGVLGRDSSPPSSTSPGGDTTSPEGASSTKSEADKGWWGGWKKKAYEGLTYVTTSSLTDVASDIKEKTEKALGQSLKEIATDMKEETQDLWREAKEKVKETTKTIKTKAEKGFTYATTKSLKDIAADIRVKTAKSLAYMTTKTKKVASDIQMLIQAAR